MELRLFDDLIICGRKSEGDGVVHGVGRDKFFGIYAEFDHSLGGLRRDARENAATAHEAGGFGDADELVGDKGIDKFYEIGRASCRERV